MSNDMFSANHKLAAVMQDLGYTSTADESAFRTVLRQLTDIKEKDVAEVSSLNSTAVEWVFWVEGCSLNK